MKSDEIIAAAEAEAEKVEFFVRRWFKAAVEYVKGLSFKTQAAIVVGIAIASGLMFTLISAAHAPAYMTRSEASVMLSAKVTPMQSSLDAMSRRMDEVEANLHQAQIELHAVEDKLSEKKSKKITTGSIKRRHR